MAAPSRSRNEPGSASIASSLPRDGSLNERPLPHLLLSLLEARFDGVLELSSGRSRKSVTFQQGSPVRAESNLASETLGLQLVNKGLLTRAQHDALRQYVAHKQCREGVALLALELISPKDLFVELKDQVRRRLIDAFGWAAGQFSLQPGAEAGAELQPLRCDPLALIQEGLLAHWSVERMLADLTPKMERYPRLRRGFRRMLDRLELDSAAESFLQGLDGRTRCANALGPALSSTRALSVAWLLDAAGLLEHREQPLIGDGERAGFDAEIELQLDAGRPAASPRPANRPKPARPASAGSDDKAEALRSRIEELHASLGRLDHYEILGVEASANAAAVKKAYFKAAKQFHPDSLVRLGLGDLKQRAAEVFARISEAFEVLSDDRKRRDYEATLRGELSEAQTARLAQAETSYRKGEILVRMGDFRGALEYLRPAVELWPEECAYQSSLGWALYKQTPPEADAARTHLEKAVALDERDAVAHFRLGMVLRSLGQREAADAHLARARQLDPDHR